MVQGPPLVSIASRYGDEPAYSSEPEYVAATVLECTKGSSTVPETVNSNDELYAKFKKRLPQFFGCGGKTLVVIRATAGSPAKAKTQLYDTATTPVHVCDIEAKQPGSYAIYITASSSSDGNTVTIEEDGFNTERYGNVDTIQDLVTRITNESQIVNATFVGAGNGRLATLTRQVLGSAGTGAVAGSDGTTKVGATYAGELADADAPAAHETALGYIESMINPMPGIVFCIKDLLTVHAKYATHSTNMNVDFRGKWRLVLIGAISTNSISDKITAARAFNEQEIWYFGDSAIGNDGVTYLSNDMTAALAGTLAKTPYHEAVWGGVKSKVLGVEDMSFFYKINTNYSEGNIEKLQEAGVITLEHDVYGVKIRETITTATPAKSATDEDEGSVVRIEQKAKHVIFQKAGEMKGEKMTPTFNADLEKICGDGLDELVKDQALIEVASEGLKPYELEAAAIPRAKQKLGRADISFVLTIAHAARQIYGKVVVR